MIALLLVLAQAAALPEICSRPDVVSLAVPLRHAIHDSPTFTYRYQFIDATPRRADAPVVVVLPGGPGQAAIGNATTAFSLGAIPATVDRIYTDPRGAGCNAVEPMADSAMLNTESLARDVIAVITARKLNNYVLYGASYGTVLATTVAGIIARDGVAPPYGYTATQWGSLIAATLILGDVAFEPFSGPILVYSLRGIDRYQTLKQAGELSRMTKADSAAMAYVEGRMGIYGGFAPRPATPSRASLFRSIGCDELWGDW